MKQVWVVGLGPGDSNYLTPQARAALEASDILCGYTVYIDLIRPLFPQKTFFSTPMTQELARCRWALQKAQEGQTVALVCSGDAGVYGMAGPLLQLASSFPEVNIEVIPGVTAALAGAALLGAPLMHDFCVISLSDLLTPWEQIEKRLSLAAQGDFCLCLYNPASKKRVDTLKKACDILLTHRSLDTVCGYVRNIGRTGEEKVLLSLRELRDQTLDMFTTVFIGSSTTQLLNGRMVTPRGYRTE